MEGAELNLKIAVISDLHVGSGAKGKDFCLEDSAGAGVDDYLEQFRRFSSRQNLSADYLLVPGDISNSGDRAEFELASTRITQIAEMLNVARNKILFCPGNHDLDWKTISAMRELDHPESVVAKSKYLNFLTPGLIFEQNIKKGSGAFDDSPYFVPGSLMTR